jgi:precorrin-2 dehydrogenase/sirohydrochlorin ferrochelatase
MIPLFLNPSHCLCVVIGGGEVGRRKARVLLGGGARVRLVCPEEPAHEWCYADLEWITARYRAEYLNGATLVFAAATPEVNRQVVADAHDRGLWVNAASNPESGDFILPAVLRRGELTVAVATSGLAPVVARTVRDWLADSIDAAFARWLELVAELRPEIHARTHEAEHLAIIFQHLCDAGWVQRLRHEDISEIRQAMRAEVERLLASRTAPGHCGNSTPSL